MSASLRISKLLQTTSISPVTSFGFVVPSGRLPTRPVAERTHSDRAARALSMTFVGASGPITT